MKKNFVLIFSLCLILCSCGNKDIATNFESSIVKNENIANNLESLNIVNEISVSEIKVAPNYVEESRNEEMFIDPFVVDEPKEDISITIELVAVGDNLIHSSVYKSGKREDGSYNFDSMYEEILPYLEGKDIKVINQETILVDDSSMYSGYPTFGSPLEIGEAIVDAGFNVITQATNHSYDKKEYGVLTSIDFWNNYENITLLGIHDSEEDFNTKRVVDFSGIKIGMLNYTYGLNGFVLPSGKEYLIDTLYDRDKVVNDISSLKDECDFVIVFPHWGTEYTLKETSYQREFATLMAEAGANLIIGTHPHVIEPIDIIETSDSRETLVYYSLGNFVSSQDEVPRMLGAMAKVSITKDGENTYISSYDVIPIVNHFNKSYKDYKVYVLDDYTEELANVHNLKQKGFSIEKLKEIWNEVFPKFER